MIQMLTSLLKKASKPVADGGASAASKVDAEPPKDLFSPEQHAARGLVLSLAGLQLLEAGLTELSKLPDHHGLLAALVRLTHDVPCDVAQGEQALPMLSRLRKYAEVPTFAPWVLYQLFADEGFKIEGLGIGILVALTHGGTRFDSRAVLAFLNTLCRAEVSPINFEGVEWASKPQRTADLEAWNALLKK